MGACLKIPILKKKSPSLLTSKILFREMELFTSIHSKILTVYVASAEAANMHSDASICYDEVDYTGPCVLLIGSEARGVSKEVYGTAYSFFMI